jgi:hypothetical protein
MSLVAAGVFQVGRFTLQLCLLLQLVMGIPVVIPTPTAAFSAADSLSSAIVMNL